MAGTKAFAGENLKHSGNISVSKSQLYDSICRLSDWLEKNDYCAYDTFDGLNAKFIRPLTFENRFLRTALQQGVRRFPLNLRPLVGIRKSRSSKGMGFLARGFIRLHESTDDPRWRGKAESSLQWLVENQSKGYKGSSWGNHFDYQSRTFYLPKGVPTVVWTSLIGHAFIDGYDHFKKNQYLEIAVGACEHILSDLNTYSDGDGACISYVPAMNSQVHNANTLAASLLARVYSYTRDEAYRKLALKAMKYTAQYQHSDGSWWYGERANLHWVDNFHTAYVLDCFKYYAEGTGDHRFDDKMMRGYNYWKNTFFLSDGTPKYYSYKTVPIDIQCCSQAIDTLVFFSDYDSREGLQLATKIAHWTIKHMQDRSGYFYYRRYSSGLANKTPTLHWGQATMLCALGNLYKQLTGNARFA